MTELGIGKGNKQEITNNTFGSRLKDFVVKGLVEGYSHSELENNAEELMQKWYATGKPEAQLSEYFRLHKLLHIQNYMTAELCTIVGLEWVHKVSGRKRKRNSIFNSLIISLLNDICGKRSRGAKENLVHWKWWMGVTKRVKNFSAKW